MAIYLGDKQVYSAEQKIAPAILVDRYAPTRLAADAGRVLITNQRLKDDQLAHYHLVTGAEVGCGP